MTWYWNVQFQFSSSFALSLLLLSSISHRPISLLQVLAKWVFQMSLWLETLSQFYPGIPRRPQARWDVQSNPLSILDLLPFGCAWKASKGRCPAQSDAHATADASNILCFLPVSVTIFPWHCGEDLRPCDLSHTGQVSNNKNIKKIFKKGLSAELLSEPPDRVSGLTMLARVIIARAAARTETCHCHTGGKEKFREGGKQSYPAVICFISILLTTSTEASK